MRTPGFHVDDDGITRLVTHQDAELVRLREQRDELLRALERLEALPVGALRAAAPAIIRAAIAKAKAAL